MKKILSIALILVLAVGLLAGCGSPAASSSASSSGGNAAGGAIKVGAILPMTGDISVYGTATANAINLAIDQINAAGGVKGQKIQLFLEDDQNLPEKSVDAFNKLASQEKVDVIIGSVASKCTLAIAPLAQKAGIPLITTASTNEKVTQSGDFIFRTCFIDPYQGSVCAKFATDNMKKTKAAIMFDNGNDYSKGLASTFEESFAKFGGKITAKEAYSLNDQDYSAIIAKIKATSPEVIFIPDYYGKDALIASQIRAAGMTDVILLGGDGWDGIVGKGGAEAAGSYFSNHYTPDSTDAAVVKFVTDYKAKFNGEEPNALAALGYDALQIVAKAVEKAGGTDKAKVRDAMAATDGDFVTGHIKYDANRNPVKSAVMVALSWDSAKNTLVQKYYATVTVG
jgi:branched-chain amino acid transport system substrate-binding protein